MMIPLFQSSKGPNSGKPTLRLCATGDLCAVRRFEEAFLHGEPVLDPALSRHFNSCDLAVANVESVLTRSDAFQVPGYALRSDPALAPLFASLGITHATLANNHIRDVGDQGVLDTISHLREAGLPSFGAGRRLRDAVKPWLGNIGGLRIGLLAVAEKEYNLATPARAGAAPLEPKRLPAVIGYWKRRVDLLFVFIHAGHEFFRVPSPETIDTFRNAIEAGADAVIGHHPHVLQGFELHHGKPIFYSLGNFCFDSDYVCQYPHWETGGLATLEYSGRELSFAGITPVHISRTPARVTPLEPGAQQAFTREFGELCALLADPAGLQCRWRENVLWRFERDLLPRFRSISEDLNGERPYQQARIWRNLFTCPTLLEMMREVFAARMEAAQPEVRDPRVESSPGKRHK